MQRLPNAPSQIRLGVRGWAAIAVGLAALVALALVAVGFLIVILPVMLLAPFLFRFLPKPKIYRVDISSQTPRPSGADVIEGDFKVIRGIDHEGENR